MSRGPHVWPIQVRFDEKWLPEPNTGCWLWMDSLSEAGYGSMRVGTKMKRAHRIAWELHRGEIPAKMFLDHVCRVRSCVNPDHLRVVTQLQNILENSFSVGAANKAKTACSKCGKPLVPERYRRNRRHCQSCTHDAKIISRREWRAVRKALGMRVT